MEKQSSEKRFALLIDADNVSAKYIKPVTDELSKYGTVTYKRIYGDWTLTLHAKWKDALLENSITPIQQFGYTQGKNATDSAMIIDAMDILYTRSVEGFCIVSSDSDFTRLASRIRESGLTVIGMGEKKTPIPFRKACDIFTTLELLLGDANGKSNGRGKVRPDQNGATNGQTVGLSIDEVEQAVVNIITDNQNNGKSTGLGEVGSRLLKRYPDFDVRSYGTNLLSKLLDEFVSVQITKEGSSVTVELTDDKDRARKARPNKDALHSRGESAQEQVAGKSDAAEAAVTSAAGTGIPTGKEPASSKETPTPAEPMLSDIDAALVESSEKPASRGTQDGSNAAQESVAAAVNVDGVDTSAQLVRGKNPRRSTRMEAKRISTPAKPIDVPVVQETLEQTEPSVPEQAQPGSSEKSSDNRPGRSGRRHTAASRTNTPRNAKGDSDESQATPAKQSPAGKVSAQIVPVPAPESVVAPEPSQIEATSVTFDPLEVEAYIRQLVSVSDLDGVPLATLGKRVRAKFRSFKLRDLGYAQFRPYLSDVKGVVLEQRDGQYFAHLAK